MLGPRPFSRGLTTKLHLLPTSISLSQNTPAQPFGEMTLIRATFFGTHQQSHRNGVPLGP